MNFTQAIYLFYYMMIGRKPHST